MVLVQWMLAAAGFGALVALCAVAAAHTLSLRSRPTRFVWVAALIAIAIWPPVAFVALDANPAVVLTSGRESSTMVGDPVALAMESGGFDSHPASVLDRVGVVIAWTWLIATAVLLVRLLVGAAALRRLKRSAVRSEVAGETVLVTERAGPAVLGRTPASIVIPRWMLALDKELISLVLFHEREHCRVGDPVALWVASIACALVPWNPALWFAARRLRLAVELDCDQRVLRRGKHSPTLYARLLLLVSQQKGETAHALMLAHTQSQLATRIAAMNARPTRHPRMQLVAGTMIAAAALVAACSGRMVNNLSGPTPIADTDTRAAKSDSSRSTSAGDAKRTTNAVLRPGTNAAPNSPPSQPLFDFQVNKPAVLRPGTKGPLYPAELRAQRVEGSVLAQYVVDTDGSILPGSVKILRADHELFAKSVVDSLPSMRYLAAEVNDKTVRQLVQQRFEFRLNGATGVSVVLDKLTIPDLRSGSGAASGRTAAPQPRVPAPGQAGVDRPYFDFEVENPATMAVGTSGPSYPPALRATKREGSVLVQFVVNIDGTAEMSTLRVLKSDDDGFSDAVRAALATMRFTPARISGRPVRQLVQQPFQFSLSR